MKKLELDDGMVAGNGDAGQRPGVATLMPPAATHVPVASTMGTYVLVRAVRMHYVTFIVSLHACWMLPPTTLPMQSI